MHWQRNDTLQGTRHLPIKHMMLAEALRKYNLFSLIQDGENSSWVYTEKGKLDTQKDSKTLNFDENYGDAGMAREQSYLVKSELNSELNDIKCMGFNDRLTSMLVRHQRDKIPAISRGWYPNEGLIKLAKQICEVDKLL